MWGTCGLTDLGNGVKGPLSFFESWVESQYLIVSLRSPIWVHVVRTNVSPWGCPLTHLQICWVIMFIYYVTLSFIRFLNHGVNPFVVCMEPWFGCGLMYDVGVPFTMAWLGFYWHGWWGRLSFDVSCEFFSPIHGMTLDLYNEAHEGGIIHLIFLC